MLTRNLTRNVVVAGAFAALAVAWLQAHRANAQYRDELTSLRTSVEGLQTLVADARATAPLRRARVEAAVAAMPGLVPGAVAVAAAPSAGAAAPGSTADRDGREGAAEGEEPSAEDLARQRQQAFDAEPIDAAWAGETSRSLQQSLAVILSMGTGGGAGATGSGGGAVRSLSCHSASCRMELAVRDDAALDAFQREALYGANVLWRGPMSLSHETSPDGSIKVVGYLQR
jgi:hypothetical protein